jgi:hypothetical protein
VWRKEGGGTVIVYLTTTKQWIVRGMNASERRDERETLLERGDEVPAYLGAGGDPEGGGHLSHEWMRSSEVGEGQQPESLRAVTSWEVWDSESGVFSQQATVLVRPLAVPVSIGGVTEPHAAVCNGSYVAAGPVHDQRAVYRKDGGEVWIEYVKEEEKWYFKGVGLAGEMREYVRSSGKSSAYVVEEVGSWEVLDDSERTWGPQDAVTVARAAFSVHVTGVLGPNALIANRTYGATGRTHGGMPSYVDGTACAWIEYHDNISTWIVKPVVSRGKGEGWVKSKHAVPWAHVAEDCFPFDEHLQARASDGWKTSRSCQIVRAAEPVCIAGVTGARAACINGVYTAAGPRSALRPLYRKQGGDVWIEYHADKEKWMVKGSTFLGDFKGWMRSSDKCPGARVAQDVPSWDLWDKESNSWVKQHSVSVLPAAFPVEINGVSGLYESALNGRYFPMADTHDGQPVYRNARWDMAIEYHASARKWLVKRWSTRGEYIGLLRQHMGVAVRLEELQRWDLWNLHRDNWVVERGVRVSRVAQSVVIGGVQGAYAGFVNGRYGVSAELQCGRPVYCKEAGGDVWIEYRADLENWVVLPTISRGKFGAATEGWLKSGVKCPGAAVVEDVHQWEVRPEREVAQRACW